MLVYWKFTVRNSKPHARERAPRMVLDPNKPGNSGTRQAKSRGIHLSAKLQDQEGIDR